MSELYAFIKYILPPTMIPIKITIKKNLKINKLQIKFHTKIV